MKKKRDEFSDETWLSDPKLRLCRPATRGIWMDAICTMRILGQAQLTGTLRELSAHCRCSEKEMEQAIIELDRRDAAEVGGDVTRNNTILCVGNGHVTLICRRLSRVQKDRENQRIRTARHRAKASGNAFVIPGVTASVTSTRVVSGSPPSSPPSHSPLNNPQLPGEVSPDPSAAVRAAQGARRKAGRERVLSEEQAQVSKAFRDWWTFEAYPKRHHGVAYSFQDSEDGRAVHKQILPSAYVHWDLERAKEVATTYLDAHPGTMSGKDRTLFWLGKQINHWISQTAARLRGVRTYEPRNGKPERSSEFTGARSEIPEFGKAE